MIDPNREPLKGVVKVDQAEIPFWEGDAPKEDSCRMRQDGARATSDQRSNHLATRRSPIHMDEPGTAGHHWMGLTICLSVDKAAFDQSSREISHDLSIAADV